MVTLYRSPVRLVLHTSEAAEPWSAQVISRARKKLMAEIALAGDEISIDDIAYSRNDAATLLDGVSEESWKAHTTIYQHKGLLKFLEKEEFYPDELKKADAWLYNERFVQAVSPFFAHSFNVVSGKLVRQGDFETLLNLSDYQGYVLPEHSAEAFQKVRNYLDDLTYTLRNLSWEKFIADETVLHFVFSETWQKWINKLPSAFTSMRDELTEQLINVVLRFQHKATWHYLHQVLVQLKSIETNDFNHAEVVRIDSIIYKNSLTEVNRGNAKGGKDSEFSTGRVIWWGIWIVLMVVRAATCNSNRNSSYDSSYNQNDYNYSTTIKPLSLASEKLNEARLLAALDSISKKVNITDGPAKISSGNTPFEYLSDDPQSAINNPITITNQSGFDAVFLYFKDVPGHSLSGFLPKLYACYIKNGDTQDASVLAGNGRVYFAFGKGWGKLKKPLAINLSNVAGQLHGEGETQSITISEYFNTKAALPQPYLHNPIYIDATATYHGSQNYTYLNQGDKSQVSDETRLTLTQKEGKVAVKASGRLVVKQAIGDN